MMAPGPIHPCLHWHGVAALTPQPKPTPQREPQPQPCPAAHLVEAHGVDEQRQVQRGDGHGRHEGKHHRLCTQEGRQQQQQPCKRRDRALVW